MLDRLEDERRSSMRRVLVGAGGRAAPDRAGAARPDRPEPDGRRARAEARARPGRAGVRPTRSRRPGARAGEPRRAAAHQLRAAPGGARRSRAGERARVALRPTSRGAPGIEVEHDVDRALPRARPRRRAGACTASRRRRSPTRVRHAGCSRVHVEPAPASRARSCCASPTTARGLGAADHRRRASAGMRERALMIGGRLRARRRGGRAASRSTLSVPLRQADGREA